MDIITREDIRTLAGERGGPAITLYMPTSPYSQDMEHDRLVFKDAFKHARELVTSTYEMRGPDVEALLAPLAELGEDEMFWQRSGDGLAVFLKPGSLRIFRLPARVDATVSVGDRFTVRPLIPVADTDERFHILAFSGNKVRLFEGTRFSVSEVDLADVPKSLADALGGAEYEKVMNRHAARGAGSRVFQTGGTGREEEKGEVWQFLRLVDDGVSELLRAHPTPLVLAAVEVTQAIYRSASRYRHLVDVGIMGNPDELKPAQLHERAWAIVEPMLTADRAAAAERFRALNGSGRASADIVTIADAAGGGRVEALFMDPAASAGGFRGTDGIWVRATDGEATDDLFDAAATATLGADGHVYAVDPEIDPDLAPVAAVFRY